MGDFTLGCLLGQYDQAQSFDVASQAIGFTNIGSWAVDTTSNKVVRFHSADTVVHSSAQGLLIDVNSFGFGDEIIKYDYGYDNDAYMRWFPDITTHDLRLDFWGTIGVPDSGAIRVNLLSNVNAFQYIAGDAVPALRPYRLETIVHSEGLEFPQVKVFREPRVESASLRIDDFLLQVDPIILHPEYGFREKARVRQSEHRTGSGKLQTYVWGKHSAWSVPLRYLSDSHAALINWWWENKFNLAFTLDTSDSESIHIVRITNERQPIGSRIAPYKNLWQGELKMESIEEGGLVF